MCDQQKILNFVFHDPRHDTLTKLAAAGLDTETIMKVVGHPSIETLLEYRTIKAESLGAALTCRTHS